MSGALFDRFDLESKTIEDSIWYELESLVRCALNNPPTSSIEYDVKIWEHTCAQILLEHEPRLKTAQVTFNLKEQTLIIQGFVSENNNKIKLKFII